uniref:MARVEL domain-containing protein n=1 Tax=Strongyloides papillosus TaxID=174720 RepID=A0A0N5B769_STREA
MVLDSSVLGPIKIIPARAYKKAQQQYLQHAYTNKIDQSEKNLENKVNEEFDSKKTIQENEKNNFSDFKNKNPTDIPINIKYYMSNIYENGYNSQYQQQNIPQSRGLYGQNGYLENHYGTAYFNQAYSHDYNGRYSYNPDYALSNPYRPYPQQSPVTGGGNLENGTLLHSYRRSRTAPVRTLPRQTQNYNTSYNPYPTTQRNSGTHLRGHSADPPLQTNYKYISNYVPAYTTTSQNQPKKRLSNTMTNAQYNQRIKSTSGIKYSQEPIDYYQQKTPSTNIFNYNTAGPVSPSAVSAVPYNTISPNNPTLRRVTPYYTNYQTTHTATMYPGSYSGPQMYQAQQQYPASVYGGGMYDRKRDPKAVSKKYPLFARITIKIFELILGAAILGLVIGPSTGYSFHDFVIMTRTEWQGAVVGIVSVFAICTLCLLLTICLANKQYFWRQFDVAISGFAILLYLVTSFLEAYFAACYPPYGKQIDIVCHRAEWIIADILCFINLVIYIIDFVLALRTGVNIL